MADAVDVQVEANLDAATETVPGNRHGKGPGKSKGVGRIALLTLLLVPTTAETPPSLNVNITAIDAKTLEDLKKQPGVQTVLPPPVKLTMPTPPPPPPRSAGTLNITANVTAQT
ncbi:hypothetical protein Syun_015988 [Stephania yunnanensis]|uniref:Uncharacterized protein n=1 Tax=Stephania yunnanensis TaxID=152371 RepID=A0AAP0J431_9MAGN